MSDQITGARAGTYIGYHIAKFYRCVEIYRFGADGQRVSTSYVRTDRGLTQRQRYEVIMSRLREEGIQPPAYVLGKAEVAL